MKFNAIQWVARQSRTGTRHPDLKVTHRRADMLAQGDAYLRVRQDGTYDMSQKPNTVPDARWIAAFGGNTRGRLTVHAAQTSQTVLVVSYE